MYKPVMATRARALVSFLLVSVALVRVTESQCPVSGCVGCGTGLNFIVCSNAMLSSFPRGLPLSDQQTVEELDLRANQISELLANDLENYTSLTMLSMPLNGLSTIEPGSFDATTALEALELNDNSLTDLPDNLFVNTRVRTLDLSHNDIEVVTVDTFNGLTDFADINLEDNLIRTIPNGTFSGISILIQLSLTGNPLRCDCELRWLPSFLSLHPTAIDAGTCAAPSNLTGVAISSLTEEDFICECTPSCVNGTCDLLQGRCDCNDGYIGEDCSTPCPPDTWGAGCLQNCSCLADRESSPCDIVDGACHCLPGYTGINCEQECPEGFFGQDCLEACQCQNGASCDFITGMCNCTAGWTGPLCSMMCPVGLYGQGCNQTCSCETGNCNHITGNCTCAVGFFGTNCSHNCSAAPDCSALNREPCSEDTPEQTCGSCLDGHVGAQGVGITQCILCAGAPDCEALNRHPCGDVTNTCGRCYDRHIGTPGYSNDACFDPCINNITDFNETDVDCGGPWCPSCELGEVCTATPDCGLRAVCLGEYVHPSKLAYPYDVRDINMCVVDTAPGEAILQRFKDSLRGREEPLAGLDPQSNINTIQEGVAQEVELQFPILDSIESVEITWFEQAPGDPLYQVGWLPSYYPRSQTNIPQHGSLTADTAVIRFGQSEARERVEEGFEQMITNMNDGRLKGTLLINRDDKQAQLNI